MNIEEIEKRILEILYEIPEYELGADLYHLFVKIDENEYQIQDAVSLLVYGGYVVENNIVGNETIYKITAKGRIKFKNPDKLVNNNSNMSINVTGNNNTIVTNSNLSNSFNDLYNSVNELDKSEELKQEIREKIKTIEEELNKKEVNTFKVKEIMDWLKTSASGTIPFLMSIILKLYGLP